MRVFDNIHEAYLQVLSDVYNNPDHTSSPRGKKIREKMYYQFSVTNPVSEPIVTKDLDRNLVIASYTSKELEWYKQGSLDVVDAAKISKFWTNIANPDGTINSNYGNLVMLDESEGNLKYESSKKTPWNWALNSLIKDLDTRQAVVRFNKSYHCYEGNKDFVCTMYGNFHIRDNKLMFVVRMRSTDMHLGLVFDMPYFIYLQQQMLEQLNQKLDKKITMGTFTFSSDSIHIYESSFNTVEKMLGLVY